MEKNSLSAWIATGCLIFSHAAFSQDTTGTGSQYRTAPTPMDQSWAAGASVSSASIDLTDENVFSFGVFGDYFTSPNISVGVSLDYWADEFNSSAVQRAEIQNVILGANAKFMFPNFAMGLRPYVLAGLAAHRFEVSTSQLDPTSDPTDVLSEYDRDLQDVEGELGADFGAGVGYHIQTAMDVVAELRYRRILDRTLDLDQMNYTVALAYAM